MKTTYLPLLVIGSVLFSACDRKGMKTGPDLVRRQDPDVVCSLSAEEALGSSGLFTGGLTLWPGHWEDKRMYFEFDLDPAEVTYDFPEGWLSSPEPYASARSETVPAGTTRVPFHMEFPLRVTQALPKEVLDVESVGISGQYEFSITLDPDFPFAEAQIEEAVFSLPGWAREEDPFWTDGGGKMDWPYLPDRIRPGQVVKFSVGCNSPELYKLKPWEGIREPGHVLNLDATLVLDGVLSVEGQELRDPGAASAPWSFTLLVNQLGSNQVRRVRGHIDLDRKMPERRYDFTELPYFLTDEATVLDLDDFAMEFQIRNDLDLPVAFNGAVLGDERIYHFRAPSFPVVGAGEQARVFLSEKGACVTENMENAYDVPIDGFSRLLDADPVSVSVEDLRVSSVTQDLQTVILNGRQSVMVRAGVYYPLKIGEKFKVRHYLAETMLMVPPVLISRLTGSFTVVNTLPFDYELRPVFLNASRELLPLRSPLKVIRVPAGSPDRPTTEEVTFDWNIDLPALLLYFEATGRTAAGRQGETILSDQFISINDLVVEIYRAEE